MRRHVRVVRQRIRSLWRRTAIDEELARELAFHYEALVGEYEASGLSAAAARQAARRALGNVTLIEAQCRDTRGVGLVADLAQDLRIGIRMLRRMPGVTAVATISLALGIGASTALAGALHAALFEPLPFPDPERLVVLRTTPPHNPGAHTHASLPHYAAWQSRTRSFAAMGTSLTDQRSFALADGTLLEGVTGQAFTPGLFATLGVAPALGRVFADEDATFGRVAPVVVISDRLWRRHFAGDPAIVGREVLLDRRRATIVGVMPPDFRYPHHRPDFWSPLAINVHQLGGSARLYAVTARLQAGVTLAEAQAELDALTARLSRDDPDRYGADGVLAWPLRDAWFGWARRPLLTLYAVVALVLLIACANVATLLLARATVRGPEMAVRAALGAARGRVIRQLLTESVLLATAGGALGLLVAWLGVRALTTLGVPPGGTELRAVSLDLPLLAVAAALSVAAGLLFGLAPALAAAHGGGDRRRVRAGDDHAPAWSAAGGDHRLREALVAAQLALAIVLLTAFGLFMHSFVRLAGRDLHFDPTGLLTFEYRIPAVEYTRHLGTHRGLPYVAIDPPPSATLSRIHERLLELPGAHAVAGISAPHIDALVVPLVTVRPEGTPVSAGAAGWNAGPWDPARAQDPTVLDAAYMLVTQGFFSTIGAPIVRGREIDAGDAATTSWVVVVNEAAARRFWPGEDPIGRRLLLDISPDDPPREVVGVVRDVPLRRRQSAPAPVVYASYLQQPARIRGNVGGMLGRLVFVVRHPSDPLGLVPDVRRAVAAVDPARPVRQVSTVAQQLDEQIRPSFYYLLGIGLFALTAIGLAAVGLYGAMAYVVAQRTREIGIRTALGAGTREILALVAGRALRVIAIGVGAGLAGALAVGHALASQLWDVRPVDPVTLAGVSLLLGAVVAAACLGPARRALAVDPSVALRVE